MPDQNLFKLFALVKGQISSYYKLPSASAMPFYTCWDSDLKYIKFTFFLTAVLYTLKQDVW